MKKDLISMLDVKEDLEKIIDYAIEMKKGNYEKFMEGKTMAMIFEKSSTRTRVSFEVEWRSLAGMQYFSAKMIYSLVEEKR